MDKMIIKLVGAMECNDGQHEELILDTNVFEDLWNKGELINYVYKRTNYMYYIESLKHLYTVLGDVYITELDYDLSVIKETKN